MGQQILSKKIFYYKDFLSDEYPQFTSPEAAATGSVSDSMVPFITDDLFLLTTTIPNQSCAITDKYYQCCFHKMTLEVGTNHENPELIPYTFNK